jgi:hypothetical protein
MTSLLQKIHELNERVDNISTQVCFVVFRGGATLVNTDTILPYNNVSQNIGGGFDSTTHTFTCPIQGRYRLSVGFFTNGNNSYAVDLKINDVTYDRHERPGTGSGGNTKNYMVVIAVLNIGDIVYAICISGSVRMFANITNFYGCLLE